MAWIGFATEVQEVLSCFSVCVRDGEASVGVDMDIVYMPAVSVQ